MSQELLDISEVHGGSDDVCGATRAVRVDVVGYAAVIRGGSLRWSLICSMTCRMYAIASSSGSSPKWRQRRCSKNKHVRKSVRDSARRALAISAHFSNEPQVS